jgi:hypothetical protein
MTSVDFLDTTKCHTFGDEFVRGHIIHG